MQSTSFLNLTDVSFYFGNTCAVHHFSLSAERGSFTTLLGPSGCGKTTLLRLIAGFLEPSGGTIVIDGKNQQGIPPYRRKVGMVFQDYALFPHLTVEKNLLYGLTVQGGQKSAGKTKKLVAQEREALVQETARALDIVHLLRRYPHELSGGQQQRVALGRALILEPQLLLMDEPFSSLDAKLRVQVREELKELQRRLGITTIFVTHDQEEALSLSDSIAVLERGVLQQYGSPKEIYYKPRNMFTAGFVGKANFFKKTDGEGQHKSILVRPEWVSLCKNQQGENKETVLRGTILSLSFLGERTRCKIKLPECEGGFLFADVPSAQSEDYVAGEEVFVSFTKEWPLP